MKERKRGEGKNEMIKKGENVKIQNVNKFTENNNKYMK